MKEQTYPHFLRGNRIGFRAPEPEDAPILMNINDPDIWCFLGRHDPISFKSELEWIESQKQTDKKKTFCLDAFVDPQGNALESPTLIGTMGFFDISHRLQRATVGAAIFNKNYWGKNFGTEAMVVLMEHAFGTLNFRSILADVFEFNERSAGMARKAGYEQIGLMKEGIRVGMHWHNIIQFQAMREGWLEHVAPLKEKLCLV